MGKIRVSAAFDHLTREAGLTLRRFPGALFASFLAAGLAISAIEQEAESHRLVFCVVLGVPLFLALTLGREARGWTKPTHLAAELGGGTLLIVLYFGLARGLGDQAFLLRYAPTSLALHLLVAFIATPGDGASSGFWPLNKSIFLRILSSALYATVFFAGLAIALVTVNVLFGGEVPARRYTELWILSVLVLQTWHFLAGVPRDLGALRSETAYPRGLRFFVQYLLIPIVTLYMLILYAYMGKILLSGAWPSGYVAWLVSAMSVLGIFNLLLIDPERKRPEGRWIGAYARFYYVAILPLLALFFVALGKRVAAYGLTEPRYYLLVLGALLTGLALYFLFSRKKDIKVVPVSLFAIAVLSLIGPWSARAVSQRSQLARARTILERNHLFEGLATPRAASALPDATELTAIYDYLAEHDGVDGFEGLYPAPVLEDLRARLPAQDWDRRQLIRETLLAHVGVSRDQVRVVSTSTRYFNVSLEDATPLSIGDYSVAIMYDRMNPMPEVTLRGRKLGLVLETSGALLNIFDGGKVVLKIELGPTLRELANKDITKAGLERLTFSARDGELGARVIVRRVEGRIGSDSLSVENLSAVIFLR